MSSLPEHVTPLPKGNRFKFRCHPHISCFTECCRELELSLTPYDVLRLCKGLHISSDLFLERFGIVEFTKEDLFPKVFLTMIDDGRATCPFVDKTGCKVYENRPGACRSYPVGRGSFRDDHNEEQQLYVLLKEPHCHGFAEEQAHSAETWQTNQGLTTYNTQNDLLLPLLHHPQFIQGKRLSNTQAELFILTLYNLDVFKENLPFAVDDNVENTTLLCQIISWLQKELFN